MTSIAGFAFDGCENLKQIDNQSQAQISPEEIISGKKWMNESGNIVAIIGKGVFYRADNDNVEFKGFSYDNKSGKLTVKDGDTKLPEVFADSVTSVEIAKGVKSIAKEAFKGLRKVTSVSIPDSVTTIGEKAFFDCKGIKSISIPNSTKVVGAGAFGGCENLSEIKFGSGVEEIGTDCFSACNKLSSIVVADNNKKYDSRGNCNAIIETATNTLVAGCKNTVIPRSVKCIGKNAFAGKTNLKRIIIPEGVTQICTGAFNETALEEIEIPASVIRIGNSSATLNSSEDCLGDGSDDKYGAFAACPMMKKIVNKSNVELNLKYVSCAELTDEKSLGNYKWYNINDLSTPISSIRKGTAVRNDYSGQIDPTTRFTDVSANKWYSKPDGPISYVVSNGIMKGTGDGSTFSPEGDCTREMFVQILYNAEGTPGPGPSNPFSDVQAGKWYTNAVTWAVAKGITKGTSDTTFGVGGKVTREQLAQFLMNYATAKEYDTSATADLSLFPDNDQISGWAQDAISWANANGIINGKSKDGAKVLDPKAKASRAEVAQMIMSFQKKFGK